MFSRILSQILRGQWAIDERFAVAHGYVVESLMNGLVMADSEVSTESYIPYYIAAEEPTEKRYNTYDEAPAGSIAVVPVNGPLMKADLDECGIFEAGMATLATRIREADEHENISSIILLIDSPGGTVDGTMELADTVKNTNKPVVAFVDGLAASAAYWIASAADTIIANNETAEVGSIGVMLSFVDMQPMWEKDGVKFHTIVSDRSPDKNKDYYDAKDGNYDPIKKNSLNPLAEIFMKQVRDNRADISDEALTGKVFLAEDAERLGLIDGIGNFEYAIMRAYMMQQDEQKEIINQKDKQMKKLEQIQKITGISDGFEMTDEGIHMTEEQLDAIEAALQTAEQSQADHVEAINTASRQAEETHAGAISAINTQLDSIDESVAEAEGTEAKIQAAADIISNLRGGEAEHTTVVAAASEAGNSKGHAVVKDGMSPLEAINAVAKEYL